MKTMNAQKFGHSIGKLFKKVDHTLSFIPKKPRRAIIITSALIISPLLALPIIITSKTTLTHDEHQTTLIRKKKYSKLHPTYEYLHSPYSDAYNGYRHGYQGFGFYVHGEKQD